MVLAVKVDVVVEASRFHAGGCAMIPVTVILYLQSEVQIEVVSATMIFFFEIERRL